MRGVAVIALAALSAGACLAELPEKEARKLTATAHETGKMLTIRLAEAPTKAALEDCLNAWRPSLRDPRAAYQIGGYLRMKINGERNPPKVFRLIFVDARAKNGFGAFDVLPMQCEIDERGRVDKHSAELYQTLLRLDRDDELHDDY